MLEVYTHESLNTKPGAITADEHGGSARLATLGEKVLESAVMNNLVRRRPMYTAKQLNVSHLPAAVTVLGLSDVWRIGFNRGVCLQRQRRSMGDWLQLEE